MADGALPQTGQFDLATYKTAMCPELETGGCLLGDNCLNAHSQEELRRSPLDEDGNLVYKTKRCRHYPSCRFGDKCESSHTKFEFTFHPAVYKRPSSSCRRADSCALPRWRCPYLHPGEAAYVPPEAARAEQERLEAIKSGEGQHDSNGFGGRPPHAAPAANGAGRGGGSWAGSGNNHTQVGGIDLATYRTKMCSAGEMCERGDRCGFAHSDNELRRLPYTRDGKFAYRPDRCRFQGTCKHGDRCNFAHGEAEHIFHPAVYKTRPCPHGSNCVLPRQACSGVHPGEQTRTPPAGPSKRFTPRADGPRPDARGKGRANGAWGDSRENHGEDGHGEVQVQGGWGSAPVEVFELGTYRTKWCDDGESCQTKGCLMAHSDSEIRRPPFLKTGKLAYRADKCKYFPHCKMGEKCTFCHGDGEFDFHPDVYKDPAELCPNDQECKIVPRSHCPFLHAGEIPPPAPTATGDWDEPVEAAAPAESKPAPDGGADWGAGPAQAGPSWGATPAPKARSPAPKAPVQGGRPGRPQSFESNGPTRNGPGPRKATGGWDVAGQAGTTNGVAAPVTAVAVVPAVQLTPPFHLATYRTTMCPYMKNADATCAAGPSCTHAHNKSELRRPPYDASGKIMYEPRSCSHFPDCNDGDACDKAHGKEEYLYHPLNYKSQQRLKFCRLDGSCRVTPRWRCPFLHSDEVESGTAYPDQGSGTRAKAGTSVRAGSATGSTDHKDPPAVPFAKRQMDPSKFKTKMCPRVTVENGEVVDVKGCHFGKRCNFAHSFAELRPSGATTRVHGVQAD